MQTKRNIIGALVVMLLLCCQKLLAVEYVYPISTSVTWATEVFDQQSEKERAAYAKEALPPYVPDFERIFTQFQANWHIYGLYNDSIFIKLKDTEWIDMFLRSASNFSSIYAQNNDNIDEILAYFSNPNIPDICYDALYYWMRELYFTPIDDIYLYSQLTDILIPYYEKKRDYEHLPLCYNIAGLYYYQGYRMGVEENGNKSAEAFQKSAKLFGKFAQFKDPLNRYFVVGALANLAVLHTQSGALSFKESNKYKDYIHLLVSTPEAQNCLQQDPKLNNYYYWVHDLYDLRAPLTYINCGMNDTASFRVLYDEYCACREKLGDLGNQPNRYYVKPEYDDLLVEAYVGHISWDEAHKRFLKLLAKDPEMNGAKPQNGQRIHYYYNLYVSYSYVLERTTLTEAQRAEVLKKSLKQIVTTFTKFEHKFYVFEKGKIFSNLASHPDVLKYLTPEEKRLLLQQLFIVEQPSTTVHTSMVADLARTLTRGIIRLQPAYFVGVMPELDTPDDVLAHSDSIINFVYQAAQYHDMGKIFMPYLVDNYYRKFNHSQYDVVRKHPENAMPLFDAYDIAPYRDVALGHHKWYNGKGYPESFDNTASPYFPIINIVMLCDCLDAATENIGRNYHTPKSFEEVMAEFWADRGTRYDPVLVELISHNPGLYNQLKRMVNDKRIDHYYSLYSKLWH